ncbi:MAG: FeoA family protein [Fervidicoccaceae archaeon]
MPTTLAELRPGIRAKIISVQARGRGLERRLMEMGFAPGALVKVVSNNGRGPLLVEVEGVRVALGRGVAARVLVEPEDGGLPKELPCSS